MLLYKAVKEAAYFHVLEENVEELEAISIVAQGKLLEVCGYIGSIEFLLKADRKNNPQKQAYNMLNEDNTLEQAINEPKV